MQVRRTPLFRQEVLDAKRGEWLGTIDLAMPVSYRALAALSFAACLSICVFIFFARYTRHELASGQLVPSLGLLTTSTPSSGIITQVLVKEGEAVEQGQALVEVSTDLDSVLAGKTHAAIGYELQSQRARLKDSLQDQERLAEQKQDALKGSISGFHRQLAQLDRQIALQNEEAEGAVELWRKLQSIKNGLVAGIQLEQQKSAALGAQAQVAALRRQRADIEQQLSAQKDQLRQLPLIMAADRVALQQKLADLDQSIAQNESQRALVLRATRAGVISNLAVKAGETATAGQRLLSLVPRGAQLQAELWLPSRAAGFITIGDKVVLRYRAYPYQKFGQHLGVVVDVSHSASSAAELTTLLGRKFDEPGYRIVVGLDRQTILAYGRAEDLRPGSAVDADILLDSRRLIEWVFEPLFGFGRSVRTEG